MVSTPRCGRGNLGSIPSIVMGIHAAIAQLGERQTEDLKVTGSIPVRGISVDNILINANKIKN